MVSLFLLTAELCHCSFRLWNGAIVPLTVEWCHCSFDWNCAMVSFDWNGAIVPFDCRIVPLFLLIVEWCHCSFRLGWCYCSFPLWNGVIVPFDCAMVSLLLRLEWCHFFLLTRMVPLFLSNAESCHCSFPLWNGAIVPFDWNGAIPITSEMSFKFKFVNCMLFLSLVR